MTSWLACGPRTCSARPARSRPDYAKTVILADLEHPGDEDIVAKLTADLRGLATESAVRAQLQVAFLEAERQIRDGL